MPDRLAGHLRRLGPADLAAEPDDALLDRFAAAPDDAPFAELVRRHGPMVLGVCRRIVGAADADDAFQAAFLVLARKAASVRGRPVGGWLYRVAGHVARRQRDQLRRRLSNERAAAEGRMLAVTVPETDDLVAVIDDELDRLPDGERAAVVACLLEGRTQEDAARALGWSFSTLRRRLDRGKDLLRDRLTRRGVAAPAGFAGITFVESVPPALADLTRVGAVGFARGVKTAAPAVALAEGVLTMTLRTKFAVLAGVVIAASFSIGTGWALQPTPGPAPAAPAADPPAPPPDAGKQPTPPKAEPAAKPDGRIRPGDRLKIEAANAFEAEPIRGVYVVEPGGKVALGAMYGRVAVAGKTFEEAEEEITTHLKKSLVNPRVSVTAPDPVQGLSLEERVRRLEDEVARLRARVEGNGR
jgi:RNA polymerase sigma factor (sigma-70 family)